MDDRVQLEVTAEELQALRDLLDGALSDMSMEIADTDNPGYRTGLRDRRERLQSVRAKLGSTT
jgi:hypothetical protein